MPSRIILKVYHYEFKQKQRTAISKKLDKPAFIIQHRADPIQRPISKRLMIATDLSTRRSRKRILPIYFHRPCQTGLNFLSPSPRYQYRFNQKQKTWTSVKINKARFIGESSRPDPKSHFKAFSGRNRFFHEDFASDSDLLQTRYYRFHRTPLYALRPATAREFLES